MNGKKRSVAPKYARGSGRMEGRLNRGTMNADLNKFLLLLCRKIAESQSSRNAKNALIQRNNRQVKQAGRLSTLECWRRRHEGYTHRHKGSTISIAKNGFFLFHHKSYIFTVEVINIALCMLEVYFLILQYV